MNSLHVLLAMLSLQVELPAGRVVPPLDTRGVYLAVLGDARCSGRGAPGSRGTMPVIRREVVNPAQEWWWTLAPPANLVERLPAMMSGLKSALLKEFISVNDSITSVSDATARALGAETISRSEVDVLTKQEWFWDAFFRKFPSAAALVELSAVAFEAPAGEALVYCGSFTNALAGHGFLVLLKRTEAGWAPVSWQPLWES